MPLSSRQGGADALLRPTQAQRVVAVLQTFMPTGPGIDLGRFVEPSAVSQRPFHDRGLASVGRLMDAVDVVTRTRLGTTVSALRWREFGNDWPRPIITVRGTAPGQRACGDAVFVGRHRRKARIALIDGLGHGPAAAEAAMCGASHLDLTIALRVEDAVMRTHRALAGTRGAALAVIDLDAGRGRADAVVVGNVRLRMLDRNRTWTPTEIDAVVGHEIGGRFPSLRVNETDAWDGILSGHTDGVRSHVDRALTALSVVSVPGALALLGSHAAAANDATLLLAGHQA